MLNEPTGHKDPPTSSADSAYASQNTSKRMYSLLPPPPPFGL
jgi:hypothetical protein